MIKTHSYGDDTRDPYYARTNKLVRNKTKHNSNIYLQSEAHTLHTQTDKMNANHKGHIMKCVSVWILSIS